MQRVIINSQYLKHTCGSTKFLIEGKILVCAYCFKSLGELEWKK